MNAIHFIPHLSRSVVRTRLHYGKARKVKNIFHRMNFGLGEASQLPKVTSENRKIETILRMLTNDVMLKDAP